MLDFPEISWLEPICHEQFCLFGLLVVQPRRLIRELPRLQQG